MLEEERGVRSAGSNATGPGIARASMGSNDTIRNWIDPILAMTSPTIPEPISLPESMQQTLILPSSSTQGSPTFHVEVNISQSKVDGVTDPHKFGNTVGEEVAEVLTELVRKTSG